jgi:hypothetical protein
MLGDLLYWAAMIYFVYIPAFCSYCIGFLEHSKPTNKEKLAALFNAGADRVCLDKLRNSYTVSLFSSDDEASEVWDELDLADTLSILDTMIEALYDNSLTVTQPRKANLILIATQMKMKLCGIVPLSARVRLRSTNPAALDVTDEEGDFNV